MGTPESGGRRTTIVGGAIALAAAAVQRAERRNVWLPVGLVAPASSPCRRSGSGTEARRPGRFRPCRPIRWWCSRAARRSPSPPATSPPEPASSARTREFASERGCREPRVARDRSRFVGSEWTASFRIHTRTDGAVIARCSSTGSPSCPAPSLGRGIGRLEPLGRTSRYARSGWCLDAVELRCLRQERVGDVCGRPDGRQPSGAPQPGSHAGLRH